MTLLLSMNVEKPYNFVYVNYYYGGQWVHSDTYKNVTDSSRARLLKIWGQHLESEATPLRKATMKGNGDCVGVALSVVVPMKRR